MIELQSTITCPHCGYQQTETMPTDLCQGSGPRFDRTGGIA
jgi:hypothetical protein